MQQLIVTKFHRPRISGEVVARPHLIARLHQLRTLTLIVAPAGYGKTTLISKWLDESPLPSTWLSLDGRDDNLLPFLTYFLAAIRRLFPDSCSHTLALAFGAESADPTLLASTLANELDTVAKPFILVLDDYQFVTEPAAHQFVAELLRHPSRTLHLVLSTRFDPGLPLATYRARDQVNELRTHDLRFTADETTLFLYHALKDNPDHATVETVRAKTEGWVAGMRLAVLYLRTEPERASALAGLQGNSRYIMDYLASEVLLKQPAAVQEFLIKTSLLDRLCAPLCEAVVGPALPAADAQTYLERLEQQNLFVFPLDETNIWFRYHHLLQELLRHRLHQVSTPHEIAGLHARAAAWFAARGLVEEAIVYALKGDDEEAAIHIIEAHRHDAMNHERWQQLELWLRLFPPHLVESRPELVMLEAWLMHGRHQLAEIALRLDRTVLLLESATLPEAARAQLRGEIDTLRSQQVYRMGDGDQALQLGTRALAVTPHGHAMVRSIALMFACGGLLLLGDTDGALRLMEQGQRELADSHAHFACRLLITRCFICWTTADLADLERSATQLLHIAARHDLLDSVCWGHYFFGCAHYLRNQLDHSERDFAAASRPAVAHGAALSHSLYGLAATYQALGQPDRARDAVASAIEYAQSTNNEIILTDAHAFQAQLALAQGNLAAAAAWAAQFDRQYRGTMDVFCSARVVLAHVLVRQNSPAALAEARSLLADLQDHLITVRNVRYLIEVLALQALRHAAENDEPAALAALQEALLLAQPAGVIRVFADLGPGLDRLLAALAQESALSAFVARIQSARTPSDTPPVAEPDQPTPAPAPRGPMPQPRRHPDLIEMLTYREMDVLLLLEQRYSNKEIAQQLGITTDTVKQHTINLFRKLHVENRRQAVAQARALGVLPAA